jgi:hypothetical protein
MAAIAQALRCWNHARLRRLRITFHDHARLPRFPEAAPPKCGGLSSGEMAGANMNRLREVCAIASVSAAVMFSGTAHAMDIKDYFKMADQDQSRFDQTLLDGAKQELRHEGRPDLALQLDKLFTEIKTGNGISDGFNEYLANLEDMLKAEVKREARNPNLAHLQAEKAFRDVAEDHGIPLPKEFDFVAKDFKAKLPPRDLAK